MGKYSVLGTQVTSTMCAQVFVSLLVQPCNPIHISQVSYLVKLRTYLNPYIGI